MILVRPSFEILAFTEDAIEFIERIGRTCYKSEDRITKDSASRFVKGLVEREHLSVIEHASATVKFVVDRGVSHELVRHRLASYSQESTRYCDYGGGITFVIPAWCERLIPGEFITPQQCGCLYPPEKRPDPEYRWAEAMLQIEVHYQQLRQQGWLPQQARSVLPNSLKTEIVMTANLREWLHVVSLRCSKAAHPQMREIMGPLHEEFRIRCPEVFDEF